MLTTKERRTNQSFSFSLGIVASEKTSLDSKTGSFSLEEVVGIDEDVAADAAGKPAGLTDMESIKGFII